jgi:hypothetical protein
VAPSDWLDALSRFSRRNHTYLPHAAVGNEGELCGNAPLRYPSWPLREKRVIVTMAEKAYMNIKTRRRCAEQTKVTEKILIEMNELCLKSGADLIVALLACDDCAKKHYTKFLPEHGVTVIDCAYPFIPNMTVSDGQHPNQALHSLYAEQIVRAIRD